MTNSRQAPVGLSFPGFDKIYRWGDPVLDVHFRGDMEVDSDEILRIDRGELVPEQPVRIQRAAGGGPRDVVWTTWGIPVVVSERVTELLTKAGFTGWQTYPVELRDEEGSLIEGYHGLATIGRCGPVDYSLSQPARVTFPGGRERVHYRGKYFDPASWDGSDIFMPSVDGGGRFVMEAVKQALEGAKVRNLSFERLSDALVSPDIVKKYLALKPNS